MLSLAGKTALVTGGSRGIGRAVCGLFGRLGARVAVAYSRDEAAARDAVAEIEAAGSTAVALRADLAGDGEAERLFGQAERDHHANQHPGVARLAVHDEACRRGRQCMAAGLRAHASPARRGPPFGSGLSRDQAHRAQSALLQSGSAGARSARDGPGRG